MRVRWVQASVVLGVCLAAAQGWAKDKLAVVPTQLDATSQGLVPKLFDDYVLAEVQNAGEYEVIGQDDIASLLGFEKQKDLLGCDDASCIADIGGALGVDKIVVVKIARLGDEWIATTKLINIKQTRVEKRTSDIVQGNATQLLKSVPQIIGKLLPHGGVSPVVVAEAPPKNSAPATIPAEARQPDGSQGKIARIVGLTLGLSGIGLAGIGVLWQVISLMGAEDCISSTGYDPNTGTYSTDTCTVDGAQAVAAGLTVATGLVMAGVGTKIYINGKARGITGDGEAYGTVGWRWLGWVLSGVGVLGPMVFALAEIDTLPWVTALAGTGGAALVFGLSMSSGSGVAVTHDRQKVPFVSFRLYRSGEKVAPGLAFTQAF